MIIILIRCFVLKSDLIITDDIHQSSSLLQDVATLKSELQRTQNTLNHLLAHKLMAHNPNMGFLFNASSDHPGDVLAIKELGPADLFACDKSAMFVRGASEFVLVCCVCCKQKNVRFY